MWAGEAADLPFFRDSKLAVSLKHFVDFAIHQTARRYNNAIVITHLDHEGTRRYQRREVGVIELSQHSEIVLVDDVEVELIRRALCQVGGLDVPVVEMAAANDYLEAWLARADPDGGVPA